LLCTDVSSNITINNHRDGVEGAFAFSFIEGALVQAVREGQWVLLDEINLASAETLQRLASLLEVRLLMLLLLVYADDAVIALNQHAVM
jgi:midasin (ATPase involved in ribosome maturation)